MQRHYVSNPSPLSVEKVWEVKRFVEDENGIVDPTKFIIGVRWPTFSLRHTELKCVPRSPVPRRSVHLSLNRFQIKLSFLVLIDDASLHCEGGSVDNIGSPGRTTIRP